MAAAVLRCCCAEGAGCWTGTDGGDGSGEGGPEGGGGGLMAVAGCRVLYVVIVVASSVFGDPVAILFIP